MKGIEIKLKENMKKGKYFISKEINDIQKWFKNNNVLIVYDENNRKISLKKSEIYEINYVLYNSYHFNILKCDKCEDGFVYYGSYYGKCDTCGYLDAW